MTRLLREHPEVEAELDATGRLLREHPEVEAELDATGRLVAIRWAGRREPVEVCNRWRIDERWWSDPIARPA